MAIISNDDVFQSQWKTSVGGGSLVMEDSRSVECPAPHGISLENGILQISTWIGKEPISAALFGELCNSAKRILGVLQSSGDGFEETFRDRLNTAPVGNNTVGYSGKDAERIGVADVDDEATADQVFPPSSMQGSLPTVTTVVIHLICHADCKEGDLSDWNNVYIPRNNNAIPVVVKVICANGSYMEDIPLLDSFSKILSSGNDNLTVALVRFGDLEPLLNRGNSAYAANIRSWLGDSTVTNSRLKHVFNQIADEQDGQRSASMFPLNHNGISICCSGMEKREGPSIRLVNPQIINGQQTLCGWWNAFNEQNDTQRRARLANLLVMVRFVQTQLKSTLDQITFANNRQNAVSAVDLRSNAECMEVIERAFNDEDCKCVFRRKKGIENRGGIDARVIFSTWRFIADESVDEEEFFDDAVRFRNLFGSLADSLTTGSASDQRRRRNRLIGLWQFSRLNFGRKRRTAIADVLINLGVDGKTLGGAGAPSGDDPTRQRRLVYALWPLIQQGLMHRILRTKEWPGVDREIKLLEVKSVGKGAPKIYTPTAETRALLKGLSGLPSGLITDFMTDYKQWIIEEGYSENDWDPEDLFAEFVSENITLDVILKRMDIARADLVTEL